MGEKARKVLSEMAESKARRPSPKSHEAIIRTLLEINQAYPEVRGRMKDTPQWKALSEIEREINRTALEDNVEGLRKALETYKQAVLTVGDTGSQRNLFQEPAHRQKGLGSDKSTMPISKVMNGVKSEV